MVRATPFNAEGVALDVIQRVEAVLRNDGAPSARGHQFTVKGYDFSNIYRVKAGRTRIPYIWSSAKAAVRILCVGYRKDGDKRDAYAELSRVLNSGQLDADFALIGVKRPAG